MDNCIPDYVGDTQHLYTPNIECRKDAGGIDEIPGDYKQIDAVMNAQKDLVEVVHFLKQFVCGIRRKK